MTRQVQPGDDIRYECPECSGIGYNKEECEYCGFDFVDAVLILPCTFPEGECLDKDHHYGLGLHVHNVTIDPYE